MSDNNAHGSVVIERTFDAPIGRIWQLWTEADQFQQWYGPQGATIPVANMDVRVGGKRLICMEMNMPDRSMKMWMAGEYKEIVPKTRLVYTESMSDENGNIMSPAAMGMPGHPEVTEVIVELEALGERTRMVMTHVGVPAGSPGEGGWMQAFDKMSGII